MKTLFGKVVRAMIVGTVIGLLFVVAIGFLYLAAFAMPIFFSIS